MNTRSLNVALGLATLLGLGVWFSLREEERGAKGTPDSGATKLLDIPAPQITGIELKKLGQPPLILQHGAGNTWRITAPAEYRADEAAATSLMGTVASLSADKIIDEKPKTLDDYGLGIPAIEVLIRKKDGKTNRVLIGDRSPMTGSFFAKVDNDPKVYSVGTFVQSNLNKTVADLRDKRLLTFEASQVTQLNLTARGATSEFTRSGQGKWQMVKPQPYRVDLLTLEEMIAKLLEAKADLALPPEETANLTASFATATPLVTAVIRTPSGSQTLEIRRANEEYLGKASTAEGVHKIPKDVADRLDKSIQDLRTNKLFDFGFAEVTQASYREGATNLSYEHQGDEWKSGGKKMSGVTVQSYIDKLRDLSSLRFLDSGMPAETVELTVASNKGTERVTLGKRGNLWFAQRPGEPAVYELDTKVVEELQTAARAVKPETAEKKK